MTLTIKNILVPTDFSDYSKDALTYAVELASRFDATLTLLHVLQDAVALFPEPGVTFPAPGNYLQELQQSAESGLKRLKESMPGDLRVETALRNGTPFVEIIRFARERPFDMIVLGTHGRSGLAHVLLGSVTDKVVRKAPCPVLTVRPEAHQFEMP